MIFEGKTLEEVYTKASEYFNLSISELNIKIVQYPSKGLFGLFSKKAIIDAEKPIKEEKEFEEKSGKDNIKKEKVIKEKIEEEREEVIQNPPVTDNNESKEYFEYDIKEISIEDVVKIAKKEVNELFKLSCFNIDEIDVKVYDDETIIFIFNGEDSALLIGKEGYRYNALLTMLFSWISQKYGYKVKLEIAEFLEQQDEMMRKLLEPYIREVEEKGRCKTRTFDGMLAYLAVEILRNEFPDKYVAIKKNRDGSQYVIVNRFLNKNE
ncbi:MAG: protein jag [Nautilia sp.]|nr:MAG: protein jag [Nautilia sp.]